MITTNSSKHIIEIPEVRKVGVYAIHNKENNKYYVGSSTNIYNRMKTHRKNIENMIGSNLKMREDLKSEEDIKNFEFIVLETFEDFQITDIELRKKEEEYIKKYNAYDGYNCWNRTPCETGFFGSCERLSSKTVLPKKYFHKSDVEKMTCYELLGRYEKVLLKGNKNDCNGYLLRNEIVERMSRGQNTNI